MNTADIRNGLKSTLDSGISGLDIAWPNVNFTGSRPYLETQVTVVSRTGGTLKGNEVDREDGIFSVTVVADENTGEAASAANADLVASLFLEGARISITGGTIEILSRPDIRGAFQDAKDYRIPVLVRYRAIAD